MRKILFIVALIFTSNLMGADLPRTTIRLIPRTDPNVDNSMYEFKIAYEHVDAYGNSGIFFKKELVLVSDYTVKTMTKEEKLNEQLRKIAEIKEEIRNLPPAIEPIR